ncbi:hypothetical protein SODALDRAFT_280284 [Sodiomyces alkalinus F11]|uniref:Protein YAE1 n=1 Tax=Sodiomyces alkalinus (strain CBS 110278 / VKM F-3762 / F11) TaxID=1314773 RepID=A0A3N2PSS8_SODAK|nr:hypothetical protein SODALDRAFT_280284 [Sodiomyces alkalinus F11]ROT37573.1 hypothetical protein SODALDRAFT_280284 [Sodiomyces alkalinus F11]
MAIPPDQVDLGHILGPDGAGDTFDDIWGSEPSSPTALERGHDHDHDHDATTTSDVPRPRETAHHVSDIPRLQAEHTTAGYREGVTAGKAESLQAGFDEGFSLGAAIGSKAGQLLGLLEGIAQALAGHADTTTAVAREEATKAVQDARADLSKERLFTADLFNSDGTWKYPVAGGAAAFSAGEEGDGATVAEEGDVVFASVADAHPLIARWTAVVDAAMERWGIDPAIFDEARPHDDGDDHHDHHHHHHHHHHHPHQREGDRRQAPLEEERTSTSVAPPQSKKPLDW